MKRPLFLFMAALAVHLCPLAQTGLEINRIFGGHYANDTTVTETLMSGNQHFLRHLGLTTLATFKGNPKTYVPIIQPLVLADGAKAIGKNLRYKDGKVNYAFYMLPPTTVNGRKVNRFLYYLNNESSRKPHVMVIYFDGAIDYERASRLIPEFSNKN